MLVKWVVPRNSVLFSLRAPRRIVLCWRSLLWVHSFVLNIELQSKNELISVKATDRSMWGLLMLRYLTTVKPADRSSAPVAMMEPIALMQPSTVTLPIA